MGRPPTWNDEQLRNAVSASRSMREVVERLRRAAGSAGYRAARVRIEILDLDTTHFGPAPPRAAAASAEQDHRTPFRRRWSDEDLARAVSEATSLNGVFTELGMVVGGTQWLVVRGRILELGMDTSHWKRPLMLRQPAEQWTDDDLRRVLPGSRSLADALRQMGVTTMSGGQYARIRTRIRDLGLDRSHLLGQGWARNTRNPSGVEPRPLEELLTEGAIRHGGDLKRRLIADGILEARCSSCELEQWLDGPIPLELDHINGDRRDNRLENLRLLCPNCHALTETYRGRNIGRYDR